MFQNTDSQQAYEINQLLIGKLRIDFKSIDLTEDTFTIEGNGFLYQDENKELKLVFFKKTLLEEHQELEFLLKRGEGKGGLKKLSCAVKAIDNTGTVYSAFCNLNPRISQNIEEFKIYKLKSKKAGQLNRVIFYGSYNIPYNSNYTVISTYEPFEESVVFGSDKKIDSINNSFKQRTCEQREMWKIELSENIELNLCQFSNYVELLILSNQVLINEVFKKIVHSLDFLLGNNMQLAYYSLKNIGVSCYFSYNKISSSNISMLPPLLKSEEPEIKAEHSKLFKSYFQYIYKADNEQYKKLLKSHKRIIASSRLYTFNFGQSLAIQIEFIACEFLKEYELNLLDEKEFKSDVQKTLDFVKNNCNFQHDRSKDWIKDRLEPGLLKEKWSAAKLIKRLIEGKAICGKYRSWHQLRNCSAHGSDIGSNHENLIERIYDCIEIYYTLIYYIIKYEGLYSRPNINDFAAYKRYNLPGSTT